MFSTFAIVDPTKPNPPKTENLDPTQPMDQPNPWVNPTHGSTNPTHGQPNPWVNPTHGQLCSAYTASTTRP